MPRSAIGSKAPKRISIDGIGGVFIYANDAKSLSNWYAHTFGLKLETYEEGKVYGTEFKYRRLSDRRRSIRPFFRSRSPRRLCLLSGARSGSITG